MAFKGNLPIGSAAHIVLELDLAASAPAHLLVGYGRNGGVPVGFGKSVLPGLSEEIDLHLDSEGALTITVDMSRNTDSGMLHVNGSAERIMGDTDWLFTVS